jgi:phosphoglycerate kinase
MGEINFFPDDLEAKDLKIILRLDFNVPIKDKVIKDDSRITLCLPFINRLIEKKAKIIIISHLGRPKGINVPDLSLIPIYKYLKDSLKTNVYFFRGTFDGETKEKFSHLKGGEVILIENIRFFKEETEDDQDFSKKLGELGDIYINDAFSCSHRKQASVHSITKFVKKSYAGPLLKKEITAINLVIKNKKEPVTCIIGGSKISTKINVITNLLKKVNNIVIVGAMANNFFVHKNLKVGKSLIEKNTKEIIANIYKKAEEHNCKILIPEDCMVGTDFEGTGKNKNLDEIQENEIILDIGFNTIKKIQKKINESNTVLWNGPAGYFENKNFLKGTLSIAENISKNTVERSLISILGGGDTLAAINKSDAKLTFSHLSTAGGAFLEYLEGKDLPGISVLK